MRLPLLSSVGWLRGSDGSGPVQSACAGTSQAELRPRPLPFAGVGGPRPAAWLCWAPVHSSSSCLPLPSGGSVTPFLLQPCWAPSCPEHPGLLDRPSFLPTLQPLA